MFLSTPFVTCHERQAPAYLASKPVSFPRENIRALEHTLADAAGGYSRVLKNCRSHGDLGCRWDAEAMQSQQRMDRHVRHFAPVDLHQKVPPANGHMRLGRSKSADPRSRPEAGQFNPDAKSAKKTFEHHPNHVAVAGAVLYENFPRVFRPTRVAETADVAATEQFTAQQNAPTLLREDKWQMDMVQCRRTMGPMNFTLMDQHDVVPENRPRLIRHRAGPKQALGPNETLSVIGGKHNEKVLFSGYKLKEGQSVRPHHLQKFNLINNCMFP